MPMTATQAQQLYVAYFNRPADTLGLAYWMTKDAAAASAAFAASTEYAATYAGMSTAARVDSIYTNLFGRPSEPDGLKFWGGLIESGKITVSDAVTAIAKGAQGTDLVAYNNKVKAAEAFTTALDTSAEIVAYSGTTANAAAKVWLTGITTDATLTTATTTTALNASIVTVTAAAVVVTAPVAFTTGADTINGTAGNDTFNASEIGGVAAWTVGDKVDGGLGADVLNVTQTAAITAPIGATVTGVETINLTSGTTGNSLNASSFTGLTALNVTGVTAQTVTAAATTAIAVTGSTTTGATVINGGSTVSFTGTGATGGTIDIGATTAAAGAVTVKSTSIGTGGTTGNVIGVTGGTTVDVTQVIGSTLNATTTAGAVTVTGGASTTSVTVSDTAAVTASGTKAGRINGAVTVNDANAASGTAAGTIASVSLSSFAAAAIDSSALTSVSLAGTGTSVTIGRGALTAVPTANTLAVNLNGLTLTGTLLDNEAGADDGFVTINVNSTGAASKINDLQVADATTINVAGDKAVTFTGNTVVTSLTAINVTSTGGASFGTALGTGVVFTGGDGADKVSLGATTKTITMGAGNDTVTSAGLVGTGGSVDAGAGEDTIVMSGAEADAADASATFNTKFKNFEVLSVTTGATETFDVAGINNVSKITTIGANGLVVNNIATGATLTLTGASTALTMGIANAAFNASDVLNVVLENSTAGAVAYGSTTAVSVETVNISTSDTGTGTDVAATIDTATLVGALTTKIVVSGNNGLTLTNTANVKVTTFDAAGVVANGTTDTAANLAVSFLSANTTVGASITITGGAGNDVLKGNAAVVNSNTITGGEGADTITTGLGNDTIILTETTAAIDTVIFVTTANNGIDTITGFAAGTGIDVAVILDAATTATTAAAAAAVVETSTNVTLTSGATAFALTGASSTTGDVVEINAVLSSFGNLGAANVVDGTELLKALSSTNVAAASFTATTADDDFYVMAYQNGNGYLYQVTNGANTAVIASEIALVGVFTGQAVGIFATGDFVMV